MKKIITGLFAIGAFALTATAQTTGSGQSENVNLSRAERNAQRQDRISPRLLEQLNLNESQKEKIKFINEDYRNKMQEMIKTDLTTDERKAKRSVFEADKKAKILAVLTADQQKKLNELQKSGGMGTSEYKEKIKTDEGSTKIKVKKD